MTASPRSIRVVAAVIAHQPDGWWWQVLAPLGIERGTGKAFGGSDLSEVHKVGMAAISLHQDATRYFDWHHTANDTLDKIDREQLRQNVATYAVVAYMAASAEGDFGSAPGAFASDGGE